MRVFEANSADEVWLRAAKVVLDEGRGQETRLGPCVELPHVSFTIQDPRQRWVVSRSPALNPAFALAEVLWIMNGHNDAGFLNFWNRKLHEYAGRTSQYPGAYGQRLRRQFGLDQIDRAARALQANPNSRQVVLQLWDPTLDLPDATGQPASQDVPCNVTALVKVRDGRLDWLQVVRSNDLFLGVPHNFVQFASIQEILAGWIGVQPGTYTQVSDSLHVYENDIPRVLSSGPVDGPSNEAGLCLPREESEPALNELDRRARIMTRPDLTPTALSDAVHSFEGPPEFANWLRVLGAEAARRRTWVDLSREQATSLTDPLLSLLWSRWESRVAPIERRGELQVVEGL